MIWIVYHMILYMWGFLSIDVIVYIINEVFSMEKKKKWWPGNSALLHKTEILTAKCWQTKAKWRK